MSKTNNEPMQPEAQTGESLKLDVTVRPIAPMGNLLMSPVQNPKMQMLRSL